ncbi:MAG: PAS domain S-box protein [Vicinamibacteria bacterium]
MSSRLVAVAGRTFRLSLVRDITDRKAQEAELRKVSSAVEQSPVSIVITDLDGRIEFVNPRFTEVSGYSLEELRGRNPRVIKSGLTPRETFTDLWRTISAGKVWRGEIVNRSKAGQLYVELAVIAPVTDAAGRTTHYVGVKEDITARNAMEHALRESEERYRLIADHTKDMIWLADVATGFFTWVSPSFTRVRGFTPEELVGTPVVAMQHPGARHRVGAGLAERIAAFEKGDESARHQTDELEALCKDGSYIWTEVVTTLMADATGKVRTMLGVTRDITSRRRAEAELRKLTSAIEQSPVSIVITNLDAEIEYVNPWFTLTTGYSLEEVRGKNPRILQSGDTPPEQHVEMWKTLTAGEVWRGELHNKRKNGERYVELAVIAPVLDENGYVTHYVAIKEDITERKRIERALVESEEHYRLLAENSRDMIWLGDLETGAFTYVSPGSRAVCGRDPAELVGRPLATLGPGTGGGLAVDELAARAAALAAGDEAARHRADEVPIAKPDGARAWIEVATTLMASRGDRAGPGAGGGARRHRPKGRGGRPARERGRGSRRAQTIAQLGGWELDLRTGRLSRSPGGLPHLRALAGRLGRVLGGLLRGRAPRRPRPRQAEYFSSFGDEAPREVDHRIRLGGNDVRWVQARWRTEFDGGAPVRVSGTIQDVTERMRSEELRQRRDELRQVEYDVRRAITERQTVEAAAPAVLRALAPRLGFEAGLVALLDGADHDLRTVAAWTDGSDEARAVAEVGRELHLFHGPALDERLAGRR